MWQNWPIAGQPAEGTDVTFDDIRKEVIMYRELFRFAKVQGWFAPAMVGLALVESMFDGLSLALIIPLMQTLGPSTAGSQDGFSGFLSGIVDGIPAESRLTVLVAAILLAVVLKALVHYLNMVVLTMIYGRLSHALRVGIFERIMSLPLAVWERERSGRHFNILDNETWRATDALYTLFAVITNLSTFLVLMLLLLLLSWRLTLIALLCIALVPPLMHLLNRYIVQVRDFGFKANEALSQTTWTVLNGLRTIHTLGREDFETRRFTENSGHVRDFGWRIGLIANASSPVTEVLITAVVALLAVLVDATQVAVPTLVGFLAILYRLQPKVLNLASLQSRLTSLRTPVVEVMRVLSETAPDPSQQDGKPFKGLTDSIALADVTFTYYGTARPALAGLTLRIARGRTYAVVGLSGAGKSTLLDLLLRFQTPERGSIHVDGVDLSEIDMKSWRARIAIVSQDPYLFDETVRGNILYGRPDATEAELIEAARAACADEFIRLLPNGYDTKVGERGTQISGGQRQRLSLARALIRDPDILILDEATNALDAVTERELRSALMAHERPRTVVIVAHRLSMIEIADHAFVLEGGRLVEEGSPSELLRSGGKLAQIFGAPAEQATSTVTT
jgi:subfamily B ATP-binding cassette protein MsbA